MLTFYPLNQWPTDEHVEKASPFADEEIGEAAEYIFWHPHFEQTQDQTQLVSQEAITKHKKHILVYIQQSRAVELNR